MREEWLIFTILNYCRQGQKLWGYKPEECGTVCLIVYIYMRQSSEDLYYIQGYPWLIGEIIVLQVRIILYTCKINLPHFLYGGKQQTHYI